MTWTYIVANAGNVPLTDVTVTDDQLAGVTCPRDSLEAGTSMTCTVQGIAVLGQYTNTATVVGSYGSVKVSDSDPSHYRGVKPNFPIYLPLVLRQKN